MAEGLTNPSIAGRLGVGETTVRTHVSHILDKLHVQTRVQAVLLGLDQGVVRPCDPLPNRARDLRPTAVGVLSEQGADALPVKGF